MTRGQLKARRAVIKTIEAVQAEETVNILDVIGYVLFGVALVVMLGSVGTIEITVGAIPRSSLIMLTASGIYIISYALLILRRKGMEI